MDPENTTTIDTAAVAATTEQPGTQPAGAAGAAQEVTFTAEQQAHVNRIAANARAQGRAERVAPAAKPAPVSNANANAKPSNDQPDLRVEFEEMRRQQTELMQQLDYTKRTARLGLDDTRAGALFRVYQANPDGFDEVVSALGIKAPTPAATAAQPATTTEAHRPPAAAPSAPTSASLPMNGGVPDIFAMTDAQLRQQGPGWVRAQLESLWKIGNQLSGAPVRPSPPSQRK